MQIEGIARKLGCTVDQLRSQYRVNAAKLRGMQARAIATGEKVNGYTADRLAELAAVTEEMAEVNR